MLSPVAGCGKLSAAVWQPVCRTKKLFSALSNTSISRADLRTNTSRRNIARRRDETGTFRYYESMKKALQLGAGLGVCVLVAPKLYGTQFYSTHVFGLLFFFTMYGVALAMGHFDRRVDGRVANAPPPLE